MRQPRDIPIPEDDDGDLLIKEEETLSELEEA